MQSCYTDVADLNYIKNSESELNQRLVQNNQNIHAQKTNKKQLLYMTKNTKKHNLYKKHQQDTTRLNKDNRECILVYPQYLLIIPQGEFVWWYLLYLVRPWLSHPAVHGGSKQRSVETGLMFGFSAGMRMRYLFGYLFNDMSVSVLLEENLFLRT